MAETRSQPATTDRTLRRSRALDFVRNILKRPTTWLLGGRGIQLVNSVLLSTVVIRRFGLAMVGTYAIGYIAVAFIPHIGSLGLNSELPRTRRPVPELIYIAAAIQGFMLLLVAPATFGYSMLMASSRAETPIIFVVSLFGCFTGISNVAVTLNILLRKYRAAFTSPLIETLAIVLGAFLAHTGLRFACFVLAGKALTCVLVWPRNRMISVPIIEIAPTARQGTKYLSLDLLVELSNQLMPLILGIAAPRAQLGLYRLCQQTLGAAETPGWSYVQGKYPEMTDGNDQVNRRIERQSIRIGIGASLLCALGSIPLAFLLFRTPVVALMITVLSAALTSRYILYVNDQRLRAEGRIAQSAILVILRIAIFAAVLSITVRPFGVWAGIWTTAIGAIAFGWIYQRVARGKPSPGVLAR